MLVATHYYIDPILLEYRHELSSQIHIRPMIFRTCKKRMVKERNLPFSVGGFDLAFEPIQLLGIHVVAIKREKLNTFHQRLDAFQDDDVRTAGGAEYNDFFGYKEGEWFDAVGNDLR